MTKPHANADKSKGGGHAPKAARKRPTRKQTTRGRFLAVNSRAKKVTCALSVLATSRRTLRVVCLCYSGAARQGEAAQWVQWWLASRPWRPRCGGAGIPHLLRRQLLGSVPASKLTTIPVPARVPNCRPARNCIRPTDQLQCACGTSSNESVADWTVGSRSSVPLAACSLAPATRRPGASIAPAVRGEVAGGGRVSQNTRL